MSVLLIIFILFQAYVSLIEAFEWDQFLILYESSEALVRLQEVLKLSPLHKEMIITVRQLEAGPAKDFR